MEAAFSLPAVITISRATGQIVGVQYEDLDAGTVAAFGSRLARALDTAKDINREGENNVTIPEPAGAG